MKNEKLFKEASKGRCVFKGINHVYILDNGCKLEYYKDGSIKAYSTAGGSCFYREYNDRETQRLLDAGFEVTSLEVSIQTLKKNMQKAQERRSFVRHSSYQDIFDRYVEKLRTIKRYGFENK